MEKTVLKGYIMRSLRPVIFWSNRSAFFLRRSAAEGSPAIGLTKTDTSLSRVVDETVRPLLVDTLGA